MFATRLPRCSFSPLHPLRFFRSSQTRPSLDIVLFVSDIISGSSTKRRATDSSLVVALRTYENLQHEERVYDWIIESD